MERTTRLETRYLHLGKVAPLPDELRSHILHPFCLVRGLLYDSLSSLSTHFSKFF